MSKQRAESPRKICPICRKDVAARGLTNHIRLLHKTQANPSAFSGVNASVNTAKPIADFQTALVTIGVNLALKLIEKFIEAAEREKQREIAMLKAKYPGQDIIRIRKFDV